MTTTDLPRANNFPTEQAENRPLKRNRLSILIIDVVESVRLIEQFEDEAIRSWQSLVRLTTETVIEPLGGKLVRSVGDGMLVSFPQSGTAARAALEIQRLSGKLNQGVEKGRRIALRIAGNTADLVVDAIDVFGTGINVAARMLNLAAPGEIVVTESFRAGLYDGLEADITDLGPCLLRHLRNPVRVYRLGDTTDTPVIDSLVMAVDHSRPSIAVLPFQYLGQKPEYSILGEALADQTIAKLSVSDCLTVVSRFSSAAQALGELSADRVGQLLKAQFLVCGTYQICDGALRLNFNLIEAATGRIVWADSVTEPCADSFAMQERMAALMASWAGSAILKHELKRAHSTPIQNLDTYALSLGAVDQMHRASRRGFERSRQMLNYLCEREPRNCAHFAWLAKWYVLKLVQGWSENREADTSNAESASARALSLEPTNSLSLCIDGLIAAYMKRDMSLAAGRYRASLNSNPNESLAWLFQSTLHSYTGQGCRAAAAAEFAMRLTPIDPLKYFYQSLAATAVLADAQYEKAIELCKASLKLNRQHTSTLKTLIIAQALSGRVDHARSSLRTLLDLDPDFGVRSFLERYPGCDGATAQRYVEALREAGAPE